jgi:hypothetical protein
MILEQMIYRRRSALLTISFLALRDEFIRLPWE